MARVLYVIYLMARVLLVIYFMARVLLVIYFMATFLLVTYFLAWILVNIETFGNLRRVCRAELHKQVQTLLCLFRIRKIRCWSSHLLQYLMLKYRGLFLGRNPDWSLKSFPPCYSQSPLQLCLQISVPSNSTQLLAYFFKLTQPLTYFCSSVIVHCKREIEEIHTEISSPRTLKILPRNLNKIVRSWIRLQDSKATVQTSGFYI